MKHDIITEKGDAVTPVILITIKKRSSIQSNLDISKLMELYFTDSIYLSTNLFATRVIWTCKKKDPNAKLWLKKVIKMHFCFR